ncbi:hypothetical protein RJ035_001833 [Blastomyces gilchristii]
MALKDPILMEPNGCLFSPIQSTRFCHATFSTGANGLSILRSILQRKCAALETRKYGSVLRDLFDIVRYAAVPKAEREIEEMLIPVGMALAWSITSATTTASTSASTSASNATATAATTAASAATVQVPREEGLLQKQKQQGQEQAKSNRLDEPIALLEDIWKGSAPFGWTHLSAFPLGVSPKG